MQGCSGPAGANAIAGTRQQLERPRPKATLADQVQAILRSFDGDDLDVPAVRADDL